ncbi:MAG: flagellar filament capping protein FliD [Methylococcaceae bacterium]|nr:flagellar filament capping protein FliD [Methylococcaceae bacterium]
MAAITSSTGLGSGIDINSLVSQLVKAEGQPAFNAIQRQEDKVNTRLSGLGTLKSALSTFQTAVSKLKDGNLFKTHTVTSSNESILKVTAGAGSVAGTHTVEVTQLAKAKNSIATTEYANSSSVVTATGGALNFTYAAGSTKTAFSVSIGANASLADVASAINGASGNNGVKASIVNVDSTVTPGTTVSRLVLTSTDTGGANSFNLAVTGGDAGLNALDTATPANYTTVAAADAKINIDGLAATRSSNSISDVLPGVTFNLQTAAVGTTVNINISLDNTAISKTVSDFVTAYNNLHTATVALGKYGGSTDGSGSGNGALLGDATLRYVTTQVRQDSVNVVSSATGNYNSLAMIGVTIDRNGVMALDSAKLNVALTGNLQSVSDVFSSTNGVATRLDTRLTGLLQSGGPLDTQQTSLNKQLTSLERRRADVQTRLDCLQKSLQKQFIAMDTLVGQFKSTGDYLTNWMSKL